MTRLKKISFSQQVNLLRNRFPESKIHLVRDKKITWEGILQPTPLSGSYHVSMIYQKDEYPKVFVISPKPLNRARSEESLPHVYDNEKQQLCLFYPDGKEWNAGKLLIRTIIPWTCEWLYYYELWLGTGEWLGGGTVHL